MKIYNKFNFFKYTFCEFEKKSINFFKGKSAHYQSKSGSLYLYADEGVYRYSDHWGRVANCRWKISGIENYKSQNYYVGFSKWADFYPLNDFDKVFYITVDFELEKAKIHRQKENDNTEIFLMTAEFAHQRLKQIQTLYKEYKWATYFEEDIFILRERLINLLITTNINIQQLKRKL